MSDRRTRVQRCSFSPPKVGTSPMTKVSSGVRRLLSQCPRSSRASIRSAAIWKRRRAARPNGQRAGRNQEPVERAKPVVAKVGRALGTGPGQLQQIRRRPSFPRNGMTSSTLRSTEPPTRLGFSLVELLIVLSLMGILTRKFLDGTGLKEGKTLYLNMLKITFMCRDPKTCSTSF